jgi:hypothetical protein
MASGSSSTPTPESDLAAVRAAAKRLGLTGKDRDEYIHKHMTGFGYKSRRTYVVAPDSESRRGGGFFGSRNDDDDDDGDDDD